MKNAFDEITELTGYNTSLYASEKPSSLEVTAANFGYSYDPIYEAARNAHRFGEGLLEPEDWDVAQYLRDNPEAQPYAFSIGQAMNVAHADEKLWAIREANERREVMARGTFLQNLGAQFFDPINLIPIGGVTVGFGRSVARGAGIGFVTQSGAEALRAPFDPTTEQGEVALNIGTATAFSGLLTGLASIPMTRRANAIRSASDEIDSTTRALTGLHVGDIRGMGSREERAFGSLSDEQLTQQREQVLREDADSEVIRQIDLERTIRRQEAIARGETPADPTYASSIFTDSWMYKAATNPMKRLMQGNYPERVKQIATMIAGDSGMLARANQLGQKLPISVYQSSKLLEGEWVRANDSLINLWGQTRGGVTTIGDYNVSNISQSARRYAGDAGLTFDQWLDSVNRKYIQNASGLDDIELQAVSEIQKFYQVWEKRLSDTGLIGNRNYYERYAADRQRRVDDLEKRLERVRNEDARSRLEGMIERNRQELADAQAMVDELSKRPVMPPNEDRFHPRYWDRNAIRANRSGFSKILSDWFKQNPETIVRDADGSLKKVTLPADDASIQKRVDDMIDGLLGIEDPLDVDVSYFGYGKSKHMKHRVVDIPNELVLDFIETNPLKVMKAYTQRVGSRYEFAKAFGNRSIDDVLDDVFTDIVSEGGSVADAHKAMRDTRMLYDRVSGNVLRNPSRWDMKIANAMRDAAQLNYLGSAGLSTLTEPAKIIMEHGLRDTGRGLLGYFSDSTVRLAAKETRLASEALDALKGSSHLRLVDDITNNPLETGLIDKAKNVFYLLNGLTPITQMFKTLDGVVRQHTIIDYAVRWTQGKATKQEQEYLLRYNIDFGDAQKIANAPWQKSRNGLYYANTDAWTNTIEFPATRAEIVTGPTDSFANGRYKPAFYRKGENKIYIDEDYIRDVMYDQRGWENPRVEGVRPIKDGIINSPDDYVTFIKMHEIMHTIYRPEDLDLKLGEKYDGRKKEHKAAYENAVNDLAVAEIEKQPRVSEDTVKTFRNALSSGIMNTILMGTPADKPIITDGIVFIPMRVASKFGMKEDSKYKGYARIESGLLGLPFQFYSYTLAALNKITGQYAQGQVKHRAAGVAASLALGYMVLDLKTPDWAMNQMDYSDRLARSIDNSGLAALYSDMFYTGIATSLAMNGPNPTGGLIAPKFPQKPSAKDAITGVLGAGPSITADLTEAMYDLVTGNHGEGTKNLIRNLPFMRLWFLKNDVNEMTRGLERELSGPNTFGRF